MKRSPMKAIITVLAAARTNAPLWVELERVRTAPKALEGRNR